MTDIPLEKTQLVVGKLRDQGVEMTPGEVQDLAVNGLAKLRKVLRAQGFDIPESDDCGSASQTARI